MNKLVIATISCSFALSILPVHADTDAEASSPSSTRIPRPIRRDPAVDAAPSIEPQIPPAATPTDPVLSGSVTAVGQQDGTAGLDQQAGASQNGLHTSAIQAPLQSGDPHLEPRRAHKSGLKSCLGGLFSGISLVAGAYVPYAHTMLNQNVVGVQGPENLPKGIDISVTTGTCPAVIDPSFRVPSNWWDPLLTEQSSNTILKYQWQVWLQQTTLIFSQHIMDVADIHGLASLHVIVWPDGSIRQTTLYEGAERPFLQVRTEPLLADRLDQITKRIGQLPPFPPGTRVQQYHLVVTARSNP
jgi:hypothetical protein